MKSAAVALSGVVLVLTAVAGMFMYRSQNAAVTASRDQDVAQEAETAAGAPHTEELTRQLANETRRAKQAQSNEAQLQSKLDAALADMNAAIAEMETAKAALAEAEASREPAATPMSGHPAFRPEGLEDAMTDIDWDVVATSMSKMPALIDELAAALAEGRKQTDLPPETIGAIQRYNGPLVAAAMKLAQSGVAGKAVNSAFTHPGFMSNAFAATLEALEMPLTAEQLKALERIATDFSARETQRAAGYDDSAYTIETFIDESRLKRAYFAEVYRVLTDVQHDAIRPESVRGRTQLDLFGAGPVWAGRAGPLLASDRDQLTAQATAWVNSRAGIAEDLQPRAAEVISGWVADLPEPFLAWAPDGLVKTGMLQIEHVEDSGTRVLALLRALDAELDLDDAGRARLRAVPGTIVIYIQPATDEG